MEVGAYGVDQKGFSVFCAEYDVDQEAGEGLRHDCRGVEVATEIVIVMDSFDRDETGLQPSCFLGTFPGAMPQAGMEAGRWPWNLELCRGVRP